MEELLKAILAKYASSAGATLRTASPGGMWLDEAPQDATQTYIVLSGVSAAEDYVMNSTVGTVDALVQFSANNMATASDSLVVTAGQAIRALYHDVILTGLSGFSVLMAKCTNARLIRDPDSEGYSYMIECRYLLGR